MIVRSQRTCSEAGDECSYLKMLKLSGTNVGTALLVNKDTQLSRFGLRTDRTKI